MNPSTPNTKPGIRRRPASGRSVEEIEQSLQAADAWTAEPVMRAAKDAGIVAEHVPEDHPPRQSATAKKKSMPSEAVDYPWADPALTAIDRKTPFATQIPKRLQLQVDYLVETTYGIKSISQFVTEALQAKVDAMFKERGITG